MSLAKDESSSHRKGKEVTADDPLAKTMVEETLLSESDHSKKEEGGRDPNSECLPLIDPWYGTHIHFPVVPSDYSPPLPGHVWLSLEQRNFDISRAPLATSIPDLSIHQGETLPGLIFFEFRSGRLEGVG